MNQFKNFELTKSQIGRAGKEWKKIFSALLKSEKWLWQQTSRMHRWQSLSKVCAKKDLARCVVWRACWACAILCMQTWNNYWDAHKTALLTLKDSKEHTRTHKHTHSSEGKKMKCLVILFMISQLYFYRLIKFCGPPSWERNEKLRIFSSKTKLNIERVELMAKRADKTSLFCKFKCAIQAIRIVIIIRCSICTSEFFALHNSRRTCHKCTESPFCDPVCKNIFIFFFQFIHRTASRNMGM